MSEIKIYNPVNLEIAIIEIDEHIPSFKIEIRILLSELKGESNLMITCWISTASWDKFLGNLYEGLVDFDGVKRFLLIQENSDGYIFEVNTSFNATTKEVHSLLRFTITEEEKIILLNKFKDFPKWW